MDLVSGFGNLVFVTCVWRMAASPGGRHALEGSTAPAFEALRPEFTALDDCLRDLSGYRWGPLVDEAKRYYFVERLDVENINATLTCFITARSNAPHDFACGPGGTPDAALMALPFRDLIETMVTGAFGLRAFSIAEGEHVGPLSLERLAACLSRLAPESAPLLRAPAAITTLLAMLSAEVVYGTCDRGRRVKPEEKSVGDACLRVAAELRREFVPLLGL